MKGLLCHPDVDLFCELVRVSVGTQDTLSHIPTECEWNNLYNMAKKQCITGICFAGVRNLINNGAKNNGGIPDGLYLQWMGKAAIIQKRNQLMDEYTANALDYFRARAFQCQILKGQGIARLYGSLAEFRTSGDIDIWVASSRKRLYEFASGEYGKLEGLNYFHIHCPLFANAEVEAHVWPSYLNNPFKNKKLHSFFTKFQPKIGCDDVPDKIFDGVYILLHCYRHFLERGVGLRQVMDYYYVLKRGFSMQEKAEVTKWIKILGMYRFTKAMMWIMQHVFGLEQNKLLCNSDASEGRFLLNEIMESGNMGHDDTRFKRNDSSPIGRFIGNQRKNLHLFIHYPSEIFWSPFFNIVRYCWQVSVNRKYNYGVV